MALCPIRNSANGKAALMTRIACSRSPAVALYSRYLSQPLALGDAQSECCGQTHAEPTEFEQIFNGRSSSIGSVAAVRNVEKAQEHLQ